MPEQDRHATEAHHAQEILDVVLPADNQTTETFRPIPIQPKLPEGTPLQLRVKEK